ncbi:hypothetical protein [Thermococcus sp. ES12]|uniref:hypothetical protein n=1 Tax=Thermococcus sp. ES12 TaxID=1638246 RepID=UPI001430F35C|nr:hypothetical protein [Thermococcus sp. ES12]NJE76142.1 hypothetical protein [Thermococcus sp. ES12]
MDWKSLFIGLLIGVLVAVPLGLAHTGGFNVSGEDKDPHWGFGPMGGYMHGQGMMDEGAYIEMHEEMEEMEPLMEKYMGEGWKEMHEACEEAMGIEEEGEE